MKQDDLGLNRSTKRTRKREFLEEMQSMVPSAVLAGLIASCASECEKRRPLFAVGSKLRLHFKEQWFTLSDPAIEEA